MSRLHAAVHRLRLKLGPTGKHALNRLLYEAIYSLPMVARLGFFNGGYSPPPPGMPQAPGLARAPLQAALYDQALRINAGPLDARRIRRVLDIGCGLGGGLLHARAVLPAASLIGIDPSWAAVLRARRRLRRHGVAARVLQGNAARLPFEAGSFDLAMAIGVITYAGYAEFLREAARVLAPGGLLTLTAGTSFTTLEQSRERLGRLGAEVGLDLVLFEDITAPCFRAIEAQAVTHAAGISRLPGPLRRYAMEWAALPGTRRHGLYLSGKKKEIAAVFSRTG
jgi:SAM-dependent methyltransferase